MALKLQLLLNAVDRATAPLRRVAGALDPIRARVERLSRVSARVGGALRNVGGAAFVRLTAPLSAAGGLFLRAAGQMEQLETSLESMAGGAAGARRLLARLTDFAARTPFQLEGIGQATRQLLTAGVETSKVTDELRFLGDIAAGAVIPLGDMAAIYAKAMNKGKVQTEELNQLSERGVPIIQALVDLAAKYGNEISKEDVYKAAERGTITFEAMREALQLLTDEGGVFHRQMERQSRTLFGLFSTLKDNVFNAMVAIGQKLDEVFQVKANMTRFIEWVQDATERFKTLAAENPGLVKIGFILAGIAALAAPLLIALGLMAGGFSLIAGAVALLLSPIGLAVGALAAVAAAAAAMAGPEIWEWLTTAVPDAFGWLTRAWDAAVAGITGVPGFWDWLADPTDLPSMLAVAAGILAALTAAVGGLDFGVIGRAIGEAVRNAALAVFRTLGNVWSSVVESAARSGISDPVLAVVAGLGNLLLTVLGGVLSLVVGFLEGAFAVDIRNSWNGVIAGARAGWAGFVAWLQGRIDSLVGVFSRAGSLFMETGRSWVGGLIDGARARWTDFVAWLQGRIDSLVGALPDWVVERLGLEFDVAGPAGAAGTALPASAPPVRSIYGGGPAGSVPAPAPDGVGGRRGPPRVKADGKVVVDIRGLPPGSRVHTERGDSDVDIQTNAGWAMQGGF